MDTNSGGLATPSTQPCRLGLNIGRAVHHEDGVWASKDKTTINHTLQRGAQHFVWLVVVPHRTSVKRSTRDGAPSRHDRLAPLSIRTLLGKRPCLVRCYGGVPTTKGLFSESGKNSWEPVVGRLDAAHSVGYRPSSLYVPLRRVWCRLVHPGRSGGMAYGLGGCSDPRPA